MKFSESNLNKRKYKASVNLYGKWHECDGHWYVASIRNQTRPKCNSKVYEILSKIRLKCVNWQCVKCMRTQFASFGRQRRPARSTQAWHTSENQIITWSLCASTASFDAIRCCVKQQRSDENHWFSTFSVTTTTCDANLQMVLQGVKWIAKRST